jgi:hypothetical protein
VDLDVLQRPRDKLQLFDGDVLVEPAVNVVDVDTGLHQRGRHPVGALVGVLVHELAGVRHQADVEGVRDLRGEVDAELAGDLEHDLGGRGGLDVHEVHRPEAGVVVVMVDVQDLVGAVLQEVHGHAVDVAAVQEDDDSVGQIGGRLVEDLLERQEAILDRQRELLGGQEHHGVLAEPAEDLVHGEQRAERVAVGVLVGRQKETIPLPQLVHDLLEVAGGELGLGHSSRRREMRAPRSTLSSYLKVKVGVRFMRVALAILP